MWLSRLCLSIVLLSILNIYTSVRANEESAWRWECVAGKCTKRRLEQDNVESALGLEACKMFCNEYGLLWPKPTGSVDLGNHLSKINVDKISFDIQRSGKADKITEAASKRFKKIVPLAFPKSYTPKSTGKPVIINLANENPDITEFSLNMNESYQLFVSSMAQEKINVTISAKTFFGIRHGLETLSQLILYDDVRQHLLIVRDVTIVDEPKYSYRGILLDTARNYYSLESIKSTIDAMASVKLNTFHWHITDSQSFPFVSGRQANLTKYGAYSTSKVYTKEDIKDVVQYALIRGVRVIPEFDAPAHVGEGWQDTGLTVCLNAQPWSTYCVEPPCGQLNPTKGELYDVLEDIYTDMAEAFGPVDIFHMGGDEVSEECWRAKDIQEFVIQNRWEHGQKGFVKLWDYFQKKAQARAYKAFGKKLPLILWTSKLTEFISIDKYLSNEDYVIQVWTTGKDPQIQGLLSKGYRLIISNYDALYLDCGFGAWVGAGNNWCSPYIGWQKVYDNSPAAMAGQYQRLILGGEAALWSEQSDSASLENRLWPRAAALAERLWGEPSTGWKDAEYRMLHMRERLIKMGIQADSIQPEWCYQNEGNCYK